MTTSTAGQVVPLRPPERDGSIETRRGGFLQGLRGNQGGQSGRVTFKALAWILILFFAGYFGYKFVPPVVSYYMLKTEVEDEARVAHMHPDSEVTRRIVDKANGWGVPLKPRNVRIERWSSQIVIKVHYTIHVSIFGRYVRDLNFAIDVTQPLKETSGIMH